MANLLPDKPLRIVVPDDAPAAVAGSAQENILRGLAVLEIYDSLAAEPGAVSYTHLTLPTILLV